MREILNINKDWSFIKDCSSPLTTEGAIKVDLPHTWNACDGIDGGNDYFRGKCLYLKELKKEDLPKNDKYYLEILGANSSCDVFVGETNICHHDGGYSTFRVDITPYVEETFTLSIIVDNAPNDRIYPQTADFTFYGGLYRSVNIIATSETHFDLEYYGAPGIKVTPIVEDKNAKVEIEVYVKNLLEGDVIEYTILDKDGKKVVSEKSSETKFTTTIENCHLWNGKKDPYLYTATAVIKRGAKKLDDVKARFGCRYFEIDPERGFILNGEEYPLRGVSRHQDRLEIGNALLPCHHEEDIELILEVGANTIRLAHYQHDQYFYDLCDEKGLVIWAEIPYISKHLDNGKENTISQMTELICQNYNHASIVVWGLSNEITIGGADNPDLIENHKILNDLAHNLDKTRLTTIACVSMCPIDAEYIKIPDVIAYNHYFGWYGGETSMNGPWFDNFHAKNPTIPVGVSEYGCEALNWHTSNPTQGDYTEEYQAYYHEELIKQLFPRKYIWSTYVWNMFDFGADARAEGGENGQNHKGLITMDRKYKKDSFYAYKAWLSDEPFVHVCGKRYIDRVEETTKITVYSNLKEVELFVNGESVGKQESDNHFFYFNVKNEGESKIVAKAGEFTDESVIRKVEEMNQDYLLKEKGAILNWFDVETKEGKFSLNDKISDIMTSFRGKLWFAKLGLKMKKAMSGSKKGEKSKPAGFDIDMKDAMAMLGGFSILRLSSMLGMMNLSFTKEELLKMNKQLNRIKKPKKLIKK